MYFISAPASGSSSFHALHSVQRWYLENMSLLQWSLICRECDFFSCTKFIHTATLASTVGAPPHIYSVIVHRLRRRTSSSVALYVLHNRLYSTPSQCHSHGVTKCDLRRDSIWPLISKQFDHRGNIANSRFPWPLGLRRRSEGPRLLGMQVLISLMA